MARRHRKENPVPYLYVSVDTCAELGGQPYQVLEALHELYAITGRRELKLIDTVQGLYEKSEYVAPEMMKPLATSGRKFSQFVKNHPDWVEIIETDICRHFRNELITNVFPRMVDPIMDVAKDTLTSLRYNAFCLMKSRGEMMLHGKEITAPEDIDIQIRYIIPEMSDDPLAASQEFKTGHYIFTPKIISEAATLTFPIWKRCMQEDGSIRKDARRNLQKGDMAMMLKSYQEAIAITHCLLDELNPELAQKMGDAPKLITFLPHEYDQISLEMLREHSHHFDRMHLPDPKEMGDIKEMVQAVRLTTLWPWARKGMLTEDCTQKLYNIHKNTADKAYLDLFATILPEYSPPEETLYLLLTHDMPLRRQFLEISTGVREHRTKKQSVGDGIYSESRIYQTHHLQQRDIHEYPHEAVMVGSEFVEFAYKEAVAALSPYLDKQEVRTLSAQIRLNGPDNKIDVGDLLLNAVLSAKNMPDKLESALEKLVQTIIALESYVERDIQHYGEVKKNGRYETQKLARIQARADIFGIT